MIVLTASSQSLQAVMAASTSTAQLQLTAVFYDELPQLSDAPRPRYAMSVTTTLNTAVVTLVQAPAADNIVRNITNIFGYNSDFTTATLQFQIGSTVTTIQKKHALVQGQTLTYEHQGNGWSVL